MPTQFYVKHSALLLMYVVVNLGMTHLINMNANTITPLSLLAGACWVHACIVPSYMVIIGKIIQL